jgi:hypothetical protein
MVTVALAVPLAVLGELGVRSTGDRQVHVPDLGDDSVGRFRLMPALASGVRVASSPLFLSG